MTPEFIVVHNTAFQFLIGRLKTLLAAVPNVGLSVFQFLIGRLKTKKELPATSEYF